jgi:hypothetical protein
MQLSPSLVLGVERHPICVALRIKGRLCKYQHLRCKGKTNRSGSKGERVNTMRGHLAAPSGVVASVLCRVGTCRRGADILYRLIALPHSTNRQRSCASEVHGAKGLLFL